MLMQTGLVGDHVTAADWDKASSLRSLYTSVIGPFGSKMIGDWINLNAGSLLVGTEN